MTALRPTISLNKPVSDWLKTLNFGYFLTHLKQWAIPEKVDNDPYLSLLNDRQE